MAGENEEPVVHHRAWSDRLKTLIGHLAWAPKGQQPIQGWRKLFWRFWLRVPGPADAIVIKATPPPRAPNVMHWSPDPTGMPYCGERIGAPWTREFEHATCPVCREIGLPLLISYQVSTR